MAGRIVLFGATGYTGDLTARALVAQGARPVLAARSADRLAALARELGGLETAVADVSRPASVRALVERGDVLVSTVGPFVRFGGPAAEACRRDRRALPGLDGRGPVHPRGLRAPRARRAGGGLRPGHRLRLRLGAGQPGRRPRAGRGGRARRARGDRLLRAGRRQRRCDERRHARQRGRPAAGAELRLARRAAGQRAGRRPRQGLRAASRQAGAGHLGGHVGAPRAAAPAARPARRRRLPRLVRPRVAGDAGLLGRRSLVAKVPGVRAGLGAVTAHMVKGSTGGPDAQARARSSSLILAQAFDAAGTSLASVRLEGVNGYDFTAAALAWGARTAADGGLQGTGALGPVDGFGLAALQAGVAEAGISRVG